MASKLNIFISNIQMIMNDSQISITHMIYYVVTLMVRFKSNKTTSQYMKFYITLYNTRVY